MSDSGSRSSPSPAALVEAALPDAEQLLKYIAEEGFLGLSGTPDLSEIVRVVMQTREAVREGRLDATLCLSFLERFKLLSELTYPVTAKTIANSKNARRWTKTLPPLLLLILIVGLSSLLFYQNTLARRVNEVIQEQNRAALALSVKTEPPSGSKNQDNDRREDLSAALEFHFGTVSLEELTKHLARWPGVSSLTTVIPLPPVPVPPPNAQDDLYSYIRSEVSVYLAVRDAALQTLYTNDVWLLPISGVVLPALYALLGSMVFHLRQHISAIISRTLDHDRLDLSRQLLAVVAGAMIGLIAPTSSLAVYAISFLVGYFADIPFAELDRFIRRQLTSRADPQTNADSTAATPVVGPAVATRQGATNPTAARIADLNLLSTVVTNSVNAIFAPAEVVNYTGVLAVEIRDAAGRNLVSSNGHMAEIVFPQPGSYAVSVWFIPDEAASSRPGAVLVSAQGGRTPAEGLVPFELRADLGFAGMPLRRRHVAVDAAQPTQIDLGQIEVPLQDDGGTTIRPDYPLSVTAYQHGQRYATCVIMPLSSG